MKHVLTLLVLIASQVACAQFPEPEVLLDPEAGPNQRFGDNLLATGNHAAVFSYNSSSYDAKLSFFTEEEESSSLEFLTEYSWGYIRYPSKFSVQDSSMLFVSRMMNNIWGDRDIYVYYFEHNGTAWQHTNVDFDSFLSTNNVNIKQIEITKHGIFVESYRNTCGYNQTEWYQVLDFQSNGNYNGPFCSLFSPGAQIHGAGERVFMTKPNDDSIYELLFDEDENFEVVTFVGQDFGQYQTGSWSDVFQIDSLTFCVMGGYDDFYQGPETVNTTLIQVFDEQENVAVELSSFNLSLLFPDLSLASLGNIQVDEYGYMLTSNNVLLRYLEGDLILIGEVFQFPLEGSSSSGGACAFTEQFILQGVPGGSSAGVQAGEVHLYNKFPMAPTFGCLDMLACNYTTADYPGIECFYADDVFDCQGNCINDLDGNGVCDEFDVETYDYLSGYNDGYQAGIAVSGQNVCGPGTLWDNNYGLCLPIPLCIGDLNDDGNRGLVDLLFFLSVYGLSCD